MVDNDTVSASNVNRQVLFSPRDVGRRKIDTAKENLDSHNIQTGRYIVLYTIKRHFYARDKFMRICQNGSLDKFMRFLFMHSSALCIVSVWHDKNLCDTNLCDMCLTCIIHINKSHA